MDYKSILYIKFWNKCFRIIHKQTQTPQNINIQIFEICLLKGITKIICLFKFQNNMKTRQVAVNH